MAIRIPFEYQEVEWIESSGTQYIDTGVICKNGFSVITDVMWISTAKQYGMGAWANSVGVYLLRPDVAYQATSQVTGFSATANQRYSLVYNMYTSKQEMYADGVLKGSSTNTFNLGRSMYLFASNDASAGAYSLASIRLFKMQIYENDGATLVRDYIPCYRKSDNEVGLYDRVNGTFYTNQGTGTFSMGKAINFVDRTFQDGVVGSTNVIEGMTIPFGYEQIVNYTMLYDRGDERADITGGLTSSGYSYKTSTTYTVTTATKGADHILTTGASSKANLLGTTNLLDITDFSKFHILGVAVSTYADYTMEFAFANSKAFTNSNMILKNQVNNTEKGLNSFSLEGNTGNYYFALFSVGHTTRSYKTYNVFLTKPDDINTLCSKAGVAPTDLETLIADTASITAILNSASAVKFMVKNCTGDFMASFVASSTCLALLETSPYKTLVQSNEHWAKFLAMVA